MNNDKPVDTEIKTVSRGATYVHKNTREEVIPFVTEINGTVGFSRVGSSREERMKIADFIEAYEPAPEKSNPEEAPRPALAEAGAAEPTVDSKPIRTEDQRKVFEALRSRTLMAGQPEQEATDKKAERKAAKNER